MVSESQARLIWAAELARFVEVFPACRGVRLVLRQRHFEPSASLTPRDLAWFDIDRRTVNLLRAALQRSPGCVRGILRHELGHAADPIVDKDGCEARADRLARQATGVPVRYTKEGLQHATHGSARRPGWLHA